MNKIEVTCVHEKLDGFCKKCSVILLDEYVYILLYYTRTV
jgi:hypothetical protein